MGTTDRRSDLLRILLADDDDVHAFTIQCTVNRLGKPSAFLRVDKREILAHKIRVFEPELLIASGAFAAPGELRQIKQFTNGTPIICFTKTAADAEASLDAGASDCLLLSQEKELGACLEKQLRGEFREPHFRSAVVGAKRGRFGEAEARLNQLDQRIAAWCRELGRTAPLKWRKLRQAAQRWRDTGSAWASKHYREMRVRYLLRKQQRIIQKTAPTENPLSKPATALDESSAARKMAAAAEQKFSTEPESRAPAAENDNSEAFRNMELSFKTLFHVSLDPMFLLDGLGSVLHVNPAACALLAVTPADVLGKSLFHFVPASDKVRASAMWEALLLEGQQKSELRFETAGGDQRNVLAFARANLWFGVHLLIAHDLTELKKLQREAAAARQLEKLDHQTSTGPFGTGIASRCAEAGSMKDENNGAGR